MERLSDNSLLTFLATLNGSGLVAKLHPTHNPTDYILPGSFVHGILQPRILKWAAISFPGDLLDLGIEPRSPALQADPLPTELQEKLLNNTHC